MNLTRYLNNAGILSTPFFPHSNAGAQQRGFRDARVKAMPHNAGNST